VARSSPASGVRLGELGFGFGFGALKLSRLIYTAPPHRRSRRPQTTALRFRFRAQHRQARAHGLISYLQRAVHRCGVVLRAALPAPSATWLSGPAVRSADSRCRYHIMPGVHGSCRACDGAVALVAPLPSTPPPSPPALLVWLILPRTAHPTTASTAAAMARMVTIVTGSAPFGGGAFPSGTAAPFGTAAPSGTAAGSSCCSDSTVASADTSSPPSPSSPSSSSSTAAHSATPPLPTRNKKLAVGSRSRRGV
jgi:hypothetical protein